MIKQVDRSDRCVASNLEQRFLSYIVYRRLFIAFPYPEVGNSR